MEGPCSPLKSPASSERWPRLSDPLSPGPSPARGEGGKGVGQVPGFQGLGTLPPNSILVLLLMLALAWGMAQIPLARAQDFAQVVPGRPLVFPEDGGAHPDYRTEWWYITGWLRDVAGRERGFQVTFFRVGTGIGRGNPSRFAPRQLILAHAAIADPALGQLIPAERAERALAPLAGADAGQTRAWLRDWELSLSDDRYHTHVATDAFDLDLTLIPPGPPVLNGQAGFSQKGPQATQASYYYSRPQLAVSGRLRLAEEEEAVTGLAWLDHEWSSEILAADAAGWDWIGINLHEGGSLMAFRMRDREAKALWTAGTLVEGSSAAGRGPEGSAAQDGTGEDGARKGKGSARHLAPEEVRFKPGRRWQSPRTGKSYPVEWELTISGRSWRLVPLMDDQELDSRRSSGVIYWEGAARLLEGEREIGRGYLEMTGY